MFEGFSMNFYFKFYFYLFCFDYMFDMPEFTSSTFLYHRFLKAIFLILVSSFPCHSVFFSSLFKPFIIQCNTHTAYKNLIFLAPPFGLLFHMPFYFQIVVSLWLHEWLVQMCNPILISKKKAVWGHKLLFLPQHQYQFANTNKIQQK